MFHQHPSATRHRDPNPVERAFIVTDSFLAPSQPFEITPAPIVITTMYLSPVTAARTVEAPTPIGLLITPSAEQAQRACLAGPLDPIICPFLRGYQTLHAARSGDRAQPPRNLFESVFFHLLLDILVGANAINSVAAVYRLVGIPRAPAAESSAEFIAQARRTRRQQHGHQPQFSDLPRSHALAVLGCVGAALLAIDRFEELRGRLDELAHDLNATLHVYRQSTQEVPYAISQYLAARRGSVARHSL